MSSQAQGNVNDLSQARAYVGEDIYADSVDERAEDELVLRLTVEHLLASGEWPELRAIHQRIHQDLKTKADVRGAATRLAPHPFISGYQDLGNSFAPSLSVLSRVPEAAQLVDAVLSAVTYARDKYLSGGGEAQVAEFEFREESKVDPSLSKVTRTILDGVMFVTAGGGSGPAGWYFTVSDDVIQWEGVETRDQLLETLTEFEQQRHRDYAVIQRAGYELSRGTEASVSSGPSRVTDSVAVRWFERPLAKSIAWLVPVLGLITAILNKVL